MTLTPHQQQALRYIYVHSDVALRGEDRAYTVDVEVKQVGLRTAKRLRTLGLIETTADTGSRIVRIGGFAGYSGYRRDSFTTLRAKLTPQGIAAAQVSQ